MFLLSALPGLYLASVAGAPLLDNTGSDDNAMEWVASRGGLSASHAGIKVSANEDGALYVETEEGLGLKLATAASLPKALGNALVVDDGEFQHSLFSVDHGVEHTVTVTEWRDEINLVIGVYGGIATLENEDEVAIRDADGNAQMTYGGLYVFDARGVRQTSWFSVTESAIVVNVEPEKDALPPITIDPIVAFHPSIVGFQSLSSFGTSTATGDFDQDGYDDVVIGAPDADILNTDDGRAYIMLGSATGAFSQASFAGTSWAPQASGRCGSRVAAGDVDNDGDDDVVMACSGQTPKAVYVFLNDGTGIFTYQIILEKPSQDALFGSGDIAVVDLGPDNQNEIVVGSAGRTSVFRITASSPTAPATVAAVESLQIGVNNFGRWAPCRFTTGQRGIVVGHGGMAIVRRPNAATGLLTGGTTTNVPSVAIESSPGQVGDIYPECGDFDGDGDDDLAFGYPARLAADGEVYLYRNDGGTFVAAPGFPIHGNNGTQEQLGDTVFAGDFNVDGRSDVVICASNATISGVAGAGRCVVYGGTSTNGLINTAVLRWTISGGTSGLNQQRLGASFRNFSGGVTDSDGGLNIMVPDPRGATNGQVRVVDSRPAALSGTNLLTPESNLTAAAMGASLAIGDLDGDGIDDIAVGLPGANGGNGQVVIFRGGTSIDAVVDRTITASGADRFGAALAIGKFRGPANPPSLAVSEPEWDSVSTQNVGRVWIFNASSGMLPTATSTANADPIQLIGSVAGESYGEALANCGSLINATGDCLAVGSPTKGTAVTKGSVFIYKSQGGSGLLNTPSTTVTGVSNGSGVSCAWGFGGHVANAGNVAAGADDDLLVGAEGCANGATDEGKIFLYTSQAAPSDAISLSSWSLEGDQAGARMGPVAGVGDTNGDGIADFAVGAPFLDTNSTDNGRVFVFAGTATTPSASPLVTMSTGYSGHCGAAISGRYDINGDGLRDVIVGEPAFSNSGTTPDEGRVRVFFGRPGAGPDYVPATTIEGNCSGCRLGSTVALGHINGVILGDSFADAIIGSPGFSNPSTGEGRIVVREGLW